MDPIDRLIHGAIDMHVHYGPDARAMPRVDALQSATQAKEAGIRAVVIKNHDYPTAPLAYIINQCIQNFSAFGSICLNSPVGGLNSEAVEISAGLGAKVVWMPTTSSAHDQKKHGRGEAGINILDENEIIVPEVQKILDIVIDHDMVLATGHISAAEEFALVDAAREKGLEKIVVTHPLEIKFGTVLSIEEQQQMVNKGAFIEHCFVAALPQENRLDPMRIVEAVRAVGTQHCILTTDLGQGWNPPPAEGMRTMIATLFQCGLSEEELELMIKINPAHLLGLTG